jgi:hypothetical protein
MMKRTGEVTFPDRVVVSQGHLEKYPLEAG